MILFSPIIFPEIFFERSTLNFDFKSIIVEITKDIITRQGFSKNKNNGVDTKLMLKNGYTVVDERIFEYGDEMMCRCDVPGGVELSESKMLTTFYLDAMTPYGRSATNKDCKDVSFLG